jgi:molybdate/tungstate transport system substrate-binding protein
VKDRPPARLPVVALAVGGTLLWAILPAGCRRLERGRDPADVVYAASLTSAMEQGIGPAFREATGRGFRGVPRGSTAGAHQIRDGVLEADAYVTADPGTLAGLGRADPGWAVAFATGELALGYRPDGRFAPALDSAARGLVPWWRVLERRGFRFGRTDPALDPKGYRTLWLFRLAARHYGLPGLADRLLGGERQLFPEDQLAARVETGQLDAGVFYLSEARAQGLAVVRLPRDVNLGDPACAGLYGTMSYRAPDGAAFRGGAILYAATVPTVAGDPRVGLSFVSFLLSDAGRRELKARGYAPAAALLGDPARAPARLRGLGKDLAGQARRSRASADHGACGAAPGRGGDARSVPGPHARDGS